LIRAKYLVVSFSIDFRVLEATFFKVIKIHTNTTTTISIQMFFDETN